MARRKRSKGGKARTAGRATRGVAAARARQSPGSDPLLRPVFAAIARGGRQLARAERALEAELFASGLIGTWRSLPPVDGDAEDVIGHGLLDYLDGRDTPGNLAVLRALGAVGGGELGRRAQAVGDAMAERGVAEPAFAPHLGPPATVGAWLMSDVLGDGDTVFLGFREPDGEDYVIGVAIDHNLGDIAEDVFIGPAPQELLAFVAGRDEPVSIGPIPFEDALGRVRRALQLTDMTLEPTVSETYEETRTLLDARLAALPEGREPPDPPPWLGDDERGALMDGFLRSPEAAVLAGHDRERVKDAVWHIVSFRVDGGDGQPFRWSPAVVELCLTDWFPRKVLEQPGLFAIVPDVLRAWVRYAGRAREVPTPLLEETLEVVDECAPELAAAEGDDSLWGPAKSVAMGMQDAGVDMGDEDEVRGYVDDLNASGVVIDFPGRRTDPPDPMTDPPDPMPDDAEMDRWTHEWDVAEGTATEALCSALVGHRDLPPPQPALKEAAARLREGLAARSWPHEHLRGAAGMRGRGPRSDVELIVRATAGFISMVGDSGMDSDSDAVVMSLDLDDWLGAVIGLVRAGPGASAEPEDLVRLMGACPEIGEPGPPDEDDAEFLELGFDLTLPIWEAAGVVDDRRRLTELGQWVLPRALARAWNRSFDTRDPRQR